ncbi:MAG: biotin/lipoate A/B protein ligase family protein [Planctomycetaceae bacterium]
MDKNYTALLRESGNDTLSFPLCDLIIEPKPLDGFRNMAADAELLDHVSRHGDRSVVRIYGWSEPTLTLGYFQKDASDSVPVHLQQCPQVRRLTGGGAILHDQEITYSCVIPAGHPVSSNPIRLYELVHYAIIDSLAASGVTAAMRGRLFEQSGTQSRRQPFLCFQRGDERDVVCRGFKIAGSAQRRRRGTVLQHGSILLRASHLTPEVPGLLDLQTGFDVRKFHEELPGSIVSRISRL